MSTFNYAGASLYIENNAMNVAKLRILAKAVEMLDTRLDDVTELDNSLGTTTLAELHKTVIEAPAFLELDNKFSMSYISDHDAPHETPSEYLTPFVKIHSIKNHELLQVFVPAGSKHEENVIDFMNIALTPVLRLLFGKEIIKLEIMIADENINFNAASKHIVISANHK